MTPVTSAPDGDDALMARVAARDHAAFKRVMDVHAPKAHRIAWRLLGEAAEAEDVAQEAMLRLWQHAGDWRAGSPGIGAWLNRVVTNLCFDRLRLRARICGGEVPERIDDSPGAEETMVAAERRRLLMAAIQALPDNQRAAIVLTHYEGCPNAEAAHILDLNVKAFESLLLRARRALKAAMIEAGLLDQEAAA
jgi:RNA polymerase sigma factor (sigma-70 family)